MALILALDQLPRNLYRGEAKAFGFDARALEIALAWIEAGHDERVPPLLSAFGYLPLEHAEDLAMQRRCVSLFAALATRVGRVEPAQREQFDGFKSYADRHLAVVERFGRFPHRNALLGRESTEEERAWLDSDGETFGG